MRHRRRAEAFGYSGEHFTDAAGLALLQKCGGRCLSCGTMEDLSADHVVPLCLGGANTITNIQVLCCECNSLKSDQIADYRGQVVEA